MSVQSQGRFHIPWIRLSPLVERKGNLVLQPGGRLAALFIPGILFRDHPEKFKGPEQLHRLSGKPAFPAGPRRFFSKSQAFLLPFLRVGFGFVLRGLVCFQGPQVQVRPDLRRFPGGCIRRVLPELCHPAHGAAPHVVIFALSADPYEAGITHQHRLFQHGEIPRHAGFIHPAAEQFFCPVPFGMITFVFLVPSRQQAPAVICPLQAFRVS